MLFEAASSEIPLLIFSVLVPMGVTAAGLVGFVRSSMELSDESAKKMDTMLIIPAILTITGLACSFAHLGSPSHVFGMASGIGSSPLSNEIVVAGISIAAAIVYWIFAIAKHPEAGTHKIFGIICIVLGLVTALFTGLAYMVPTIATWNSPVSAVCQMFAALLGGAAVAALVFALAGAKANKLIGLCALIGCVGASVMVLVQGVMAGGVVNSAGLTVAAAMSQYWIVAVIGIVAAAAGAFLVFKKDGTAMMAVAAVCALVGLVLIRVCFYGIFLSVGLF